MRHGGFTGTFRYTDDGGSAKLTESSFNPRSHLDDDGSSAAGGGEYATGTKDALLAYGYLRLMQIRQSKLQVRQNVKLLFGR